MVFFLFITNQNRSTSQANLWGLLDIYRTCWHQKCIAIKKWIWFICLFFPQSDKYWHLGRKKTQNISSEIFNSVLVLFLHWVKHGSKILSWGTTSIQLSVHPNAACRPFPFILPYIHKNAVLLQRTFPKPQHKVSVNGMESRISKLEHCRLTLNKNINSACHPAES